MYQPAISAEETAVCRHCRAPLLRRDDECNRDFGRRAFCNRDCASKAKRKNDGDGKPCGRCKQVKPLAEYYTAKRNGIRTVAAICKPCWADREKARRAAGGEKRRLADIRRTAAWRARNKEKERARGREHQKRRRLRLKAEGRLADYAPRDNGGGIYFVRVGADGPIKIGWCKHSPKRRLETIQISNPEEVQLVGMIRGATIYEETRLHDKFACLKIRGEWFRPEPELLSFIAEFAADV